MASLKPARTCRDWDRPWTRTAKKVVTAAYVRGVPGSKITKFDSGNPHKMDEYDFQVDILSGANCQIRHNALDAARTAINRHLEAGLLVDNYFFKVRVYPHQVVREHAMLSGAGADRLSRGMKESFGKPAGRAARVKKGQVLMSIWSYKKFEKTVKEAVRKGNSRMPMTPYVVTIDLTKKRAIEAKKKAAQPKKAEKKPKQAQPKTEKKHVVEKKETKHEEKKNIPSITDIVKPMAEKKESVNKIMEKAIKEASQPVQEVFKPVVQKKESVNRMMERVLKETQAAKQKEVPKPKNIVA